MTFKRRDIVRTIKAVIAAGLGVARVEVDRDGKIIVVPGKPEEPLSSGSSSWDQAIRDLES